MLGRTQTSHTLLVFTGYLTVSPHSSLVFVGYASCVLGETIKLIYRFLAYFGRDLFLASQRWQANIKWPNLLD